ncbi:MAG: tyrosine-type recombinase/integrase [Candidatus Helarchaeota archaeon]
MDLARKTPITTLEGVIEHPVLEEFLKKKREEGKSESLLRNYSYDLLDFQANSSFSDFNDMMVEDVEDYVATLRGRNCSGSTINRRLSAIKTFVKFMVNKKRRTLRRMKRQARNPEAITQLRNQIEELEEILTIDRVKAIKKEKHPFSIDELRKILIHAKNSTHPRFPKQSLRNYLILKLSAVGTGARNTAIRKLEKKDLECFSCDGNCKECIPTIKLLRKGKTERGQGDRNKIQVRIEKKTCLELKEFINSSPSTSPLVFTSRTKGNPDESIRRRTDREKRANFPFIATHFHHGRNKKWNALWNDGTPSRSRRKTRNHGTIRPRSSKGFGHTISDNRMNFFIFHDNILIVTNQLFFT